MGPRQEVDVAFLLRRPILALAGSPTVRDAVITTPLTRSVVDRFVVGDTVADAVDASRRLRQAGLLVTLDHLGEQVTDRAGADAGRRAYLHLLKALAAAELAAGHDISVKLSALGLALPRGELLALTAVKDVAAAAEAVGATVTLDMEGSVTVEATLRVFALLRATHPAAGIAVQAMLHRTPADLDDLLTDGCRVRLVKGAYDEPPQTALQERSQVDLAYAAALRRLMTGEGYPMVATHDPRLIAIATELARRAGRGPRDYEFQMLYGVRPDEQRRLAAAGHSVRVYVPYGTDWYAYLTRRLAERPANLGFFLRSLLTKG
jgi:proline dehydrogenase